jgi:hypothetical protein
MLTVSVIIDADKNKNIEDIVWPENSFPLYCDLKNDSSMQCFSRARIIPEATLEQITFLKLSGFVVFVVIRHTIRNKDGRHIMDSIRPEYIIQTNAV